MNKNSAEPQTNIVENHPGYNAWPMVSASGNKVVCIYSRGPLHDPGDPAQRVYAKVSSDLGKHWGDSVLITGRCGETAVGKGVDENGGMFFITRCFHPVRNHQIFRTRDGVHFEKTADLKLNPEPIQVTDIFPVPGRGLMALWFETSYKTNQKDGSWGTLVSTDHGRTWKQNTIESNPLLCDLPAEASAVAYPDGKILMLSRLNREGRQIQITSTDYGASWTRSVSNIDDHYGCTPSLIYDREQGILTTYYYQRGHGVLMRRTANAELVFDHPDQWSKSEPIAYGSKIALDSGNANAIAVQRNHVIVFYSGKMPDTEIKSVIVPAPGEDKQTPEKFGMPDGSSL